MKKVGTGSGSSKSSNRSWRYRRPTTVASLKDLCLDVLVNNVIFILIRYKSLINQLDDYMPDSLTSIGRDR